MKTYLDLLDKVLTQGKVKEGRNGGTLSLSGQRIEVDLTKGFPLLTTKKVHFRSVAIELLWFLRGESNIKYLKENGVSIWDEWADDNGNVGKIYGYQWRNWGKDQIKACIELLKNEPNSRRNIVSAWNVAELDQMALPPCHYNFQMIVEPDGKLTCIVSMRSCDIFLGLPFNIASYALLTKMLAKECGYIDSKLVINFGDLHLYSNHIEQAKIQLNRLPYRLPNIEILGLDFENLLGNLEKYKKPKFDLLNYIHHPAILAPVSK